MSDQAYQKDIREELKKLNEKQRDSYMLNLVLTSAIFVFACFEAINLVNSEVIGAHSENVIFAILMFTGLFLLVLFQEPLGIAKDYLMENF